MSKLNKETIEKLNLIDNIDIKNKNTPDFESEIYDSGLKEKYPLHIDYVTFAKHYPLDFFIELLKEDLSSLTNQQKNEFSYHRDKQTNARFSFHSKVDFRKRFKRVRFWMAYELAIWLHNHFEHDVIKAFDKEEVKQEAIKLYGIEKVKKIETEYNKLLKIKNLFMTPTKATNLKYNILSFVSLVYGQDFLYEKTIIIEN